LAVTSSRLFLGLRGPVIDSFATIIEFPVKRDEPSLGRPRRHFLDLGGLGVRDLATFGGSLLILAGPVTAANGPFRIHRWTPGAAKTVERAPVIGEWPLDAEHPEGLCVLERGGKPGLLVVYDSPAKSRIKGGRYEADWFPLIER
jgi:hypothetical protein